MMLQPNPNLRPTTDQLLNLPVMLGRIQQLKKFDPNIEASVNSFGGLPTLDDSQPGNQADALLKVPNELPFETRPQQSGALLNTIKLPRILRQLTDRLPKPNYESSLSK